MAKERITRQQTKKTKQRRRHRIQQQCSTTVHCTDNLRLNIPKVTANIEYQKQKVGTDQRYRPQYAANIKGHSK